MLEMDVFLNDWPGFWKRCWYAIKYVFGYKCKYGHFDNVLLKVEDADNMIDMLNQFKYKMAQWDIHNSRGSCGNKNDGGEEEK